MVLWSFPLSIIVAANAAFVDLFVVPLQVAFVSVELFAINGYVPNCVANIAPYLQLLEVFIC
jgi:hypothetical protein